MSGTNLNPLDMNLNVQQTTQNSMSAQMRAYYDANILRHATPNMVHTQFGQKRVIPKNGGNQISFRRLAPLGAALTPLTEGVTPDGNSLTWSKVTATLCQYGDYVTLSDMLCLTAIDDNLNEAGAMLGNQAGETIDAVVREAINGGTNVQYAENKSARYLLVGGEDSGNDYLSVDAVKNAVRTLKHNKAKKIKGSYVAIIHPDTAYDLMNDSKWENVKTYADPKDMYNGEIGRIHGVRFVESADAKIFSAKDLSKASRTLTYVSNSGKVITISETLTADDIKDIASRKIILNEKLYTVSSATANTITVAETISDAPSGTDDFKIYPGEAGAKGRDVYSTLILGQDAYGVTELSGGGIENIIKQLGSGGTADPLNQRATTGWKATLAATVLVDEYMVRVETASSFSE